jgi:hypothetical protein
MTTHSSCSACGWVSNLLGSNTPCPWHAGEWSEPPAADETQCLASEDGRPTAERPWPFTSREYARLLLLRSRPQAAHSSTVWRVSDAQASLGHDVPPLVEEPQHSVRPTNDQWTQ